MQMVESSDRKPVEWAAFGLAGGGNIIGAAGIVTTTAWVAIFGALMILIGAAVLLLLED
jgi:hypothetical protein